MLYKTRKQTLLYKEITDEYEPLRLGQLLADMSAALRLSERACGLR